MKTQILNALNRSFSDSVISFRPSELNTTPSLFIIDSYIDDPFILPNSMIGYTETYKSNIELTLSVLGFDKVSFNNTSSTFWVTLPSGIKQTKK